MRLLFHRYLPIRVSQVLLHDIEHQASSFCALSCLHQHFTLPLRSRVYTSSHPLLILLTSITSKVKQHGDRQRYAGETLPAAKQFGVFPNIYVKLSPLPIFFGTSAHSALIHSACFTSSPHFPRILRHQTALYLCVDRDH